MFLSSISTPRLLDAIKNRLDDYRADEALTHHQWSKMVSPRRLLRAINEADIQLCGDLKLEMQVVIYFPEDTSVVYLRSNEYQDQKHTDAIQDLIDKEPEGNHEHLFNLKMYRHISGMRSGYIVGYDRFPVGPAAPMARYATVPFTTFQDSMNGRPYYDDKFGVLPTAHVDHGRGIIQLSRTQGKGTFLSFMAHVLPEKIDFSEVDNTQEGVNTSYTPVCPAYAESALVTTAILDLLPETNPMHRVLYEKQMDQFRRARLRVPMENSVIQIESWL